MIANHVPMRSLGKSDFAGLVNYVPDGQSAGHRLVQLQITNCDAVSVGRHLRKKDRLNQRRGRGR